MDELADEDFMEEVQQQREDDQMIHRPLDEDGEDCEEQCMVCLRALRADDHLLGRARRLPNDGQLPSSSSSVLASTATDCSPASDTPAVFCIPTIMPMPGHPLARADALHTHGHALAGRAFVARPYCFTDAVAALPDAESGSGQGECLWPSRRASRRRQALRDQGKGAGSEWVKAGALH